MEDVHKLRVINRLKSVHRSNSVDGRKESSAEHSWSCLLLADYFLTKFPREIDRLRVYELLMYHDMIEIETGDLPLSPNSRKLGKGDIGEAAGRLEGRLPHPISGKFIALFREFEEQKTIESRFAKAVDALDAEIHELDYKGDWKGWTREFLVESKLRFFDEFPEMKGMFEKMLEYLVENGYFEKYSR